MEDFMDFYSQLAQTQLERDLDRLINTIREERHAAAEHQTMDFIKDLVMFFKDPPEPVLLGHKFLLKLQTNLDLLVYRLSDMGAFDLAYNALELRITMDCIIRDDTSGECFSKNLASLIKLSQQNLALENYPLTFVYADYVLVNFLRYVDISNFEGKPLINDLILLFTSLAKSLNTFNRRNLITTEIQNSKILDYYSDISKLLNSWFSTDLESLNLAIETLSGIKNLYLTH